MNTMMARLWILGGILGLAWGGYLAVSADAGFAPLAIMPLIGAMVGLLLAMGVDEIRARFRKRRKRA